MPPSPPHKGSAVLSISRKFGAPARKMGAANTSLSREHRSSNDPATQMPRAEKGAWQSTVRGEARTQPHVLKYLAAERSEDGASGWYTAPWGSEWCQNHCSNHSGFLTGADTFVRSTLVALAPGSHAFSERLSFGYFSLARQRKVTAAPRRGDANRPTRSQALHENREHTTKQIKPNLNLSRARRAPPHEVRCHRRSASRATLADPPEA